MTFPNPDTGEVRKLFTKREVRTAAFDLDGDELDFYDELTRYVEDQSMAAASDESSVQTSLLPQTVPDNEPTTSTNNTFPIALRNGVIDKGSKPSTPIGRIPLFMPGHTFIRPG